MDAAIFKLTALTIDEFGAYMINVYKSKLNSEGWTNGELYKGAKYTVNINGDTFSVTLNLAEYWKYIENGRKAGSKMPPISSIQGWIKAKKIIPSPMKLKSGKTIVPTVQQLAFLIARKIGRDGIPAKPYLKMSVEDAKAKYIKKIGEAIKQDIINYYKAS